MLELWPDATCDRAEALTRRALFRQPPQLPELTPGTVRRWEGAAAWTPPETRLLCRHRASDSAIRVVTLHREPPAGHFLEFDLGVVHAFALPGTRRLVDNGGTFVLVEDQDELDAPSRGLGYVDQAPLPMLEMLELRRVPSTGQEVLVAGPHDPLYDVANPVATLGWIEPFPVNPRHRALHTGLWAGGSASGITTLVRRADRKAWRHRYQAGPARDACDAVTLGSLLPTRVPGVTELRLLTDGRLESDLVCPSQPSASPRAPGRWILAPLAWTRLRPQAWAVRATASRALHLLPARRSHRRSAAGATVLGWLRREPAAGFSPLFCATHPATGDQFVTRSELEARDLGYRLDGVLGFISDAAADRATSAQPEQILWGSRFGGRRRYVEGRVPP